MSQATQRRVSEQLNSLREAHLLPFREVLDADRVKAAFKAEGVVTHACIYTPLTTLALFLSQVLDPDHSCRAAVARLILWLASHQRKTCAAQTNTYCEARRRLPLGVVTRLVRQTAREIEEGAPEHWLWKGRRVVLVDGTTASMPDTKENQNAYPHAPLQGNAPGFPLVRMVALISLATGVARDLAMGPYQGKETGETALFRTLSDGLEAGEIVLGDRCFCTFFGIAGLSRRRVDVVFRMHQRRRFDFAKGQRLGIEDHVVTWTKPECPEWMDEATYADMDNEIKVRELRIKIRQPGFRVNEVVLVTTLCDGNAYPKQELAALFLERWNIELDFRSIKDVLQMDVLRCKTPEMVQKEIWMHLLAYNLVRGVMAKAAEAHAKPARHLSFKGALQTMTAFATALGATTSHEQDHLMAAMLKAISSHQVGNRFGRVEPRANKRRPKCQRYLNEPRSEARKRLMQNA